VNLSFGIAVVSIAEKVLLLAAAAIEIAIVCSLIHYQGVSDHTTQRYHKQHRQEQQHFVQRNSSYAHM
jgi:hypothetical protein